MVNVPNDKRIDVLKSHILNKTQINNLKESPCECELKSTNKQTKNGDFLGLLASLGIPLLASLVGRPMDKGLQIDSTPRSYRIPISDFKKATISRLYISRL